MFKQFFASLFADKAGIYDPSTHSFRRIDFAKLSQQMRIPEKGRDRGSDNVPPTQATSPDDVEQAIAIRITDEERDARDVTTANLKVLASRMSSLNAQINPQALSALATDAGSDFDLLVQQTGMHLFEARENVTKREHALNDFKTANKLQREAVYPSSPFMTLAVIAFLVIIETAMNGMFFADADRLGWLGGMAFALILSIVNAGCGIFLGDFGYRLIRHARPLFRSVGIAICALSLVLIVTVNLGITHYRSVLTEAGEIIQHNSTATYTPETADAPQPLAVPSDLENAKKAWLRFTQDPTGIDDIKSWLLVLLGISAALFVSYKKYRGDDPYFRYGEYARRRSAANREYAELVTSMLDDLKNIKDGSMERLDELKTRMSFTEGEAGSIHTSYADWLAKFRDHCTHLEEVGSMLIAEYRQNNMAARSTEAPKYFKKDWTLERHDIDTFSNEINRSATQIDESLKGIKNAYADAAATIATSYDRARKAFESIQALQTNQIKPEDFNAWLTTEIKGTGAPVLKAAA